MSNIPAVWTHQEVENSLILKREVGFTEDDAVQFHDSILEEMDETLTRLTRMGVAIRQSSQVSQGARVSAFASKLDVGAFERLATLSISTLYPEAHQQLRERLVDSMVTRYTTINYLQYRQSTLQNRHIVQRPRMTPIEESDEQMAMDTSKVRNESESHAISQPAVPPSSRNLPPPPPSQSGLSSLDSTILREKLKGSSRTQRASSVFVSQAQYPRPKRDSAKSLAVCEWCAEPLSEEALDETAWT